MRGVKNIEIGIEKADFDSDQLHSLSFIVDALKNPNRNNKDIDMAPHDILMGVLSKILILGAARRYRV